MNDRQFIPIRNTVDKKLAPGSLLGYCIRDPGNIHKDYHSPKGLRTAVHYATEKEDTNNTDVENVQNGNDGSSDRVKWTIVREVEHYSEMLHKIPRSSKKKIRLSMSERKSAYMVVSTMSTIILPKDGMIGNLHDIKINPKSTCHCCCCHRCTPPSCIHIESADVQHYVSEDENLEKIEVCKLSEKKYSVLHFWKWVPGMRWLFLCVDFKLKENTSGSPV
jgi:hypothetical protein